MDEQILAELQQIRSYLEQLINPEETDIESFVERPGLFVTTEE